MTRSGSARSPRPGRLRMTATSAMSPRSRARTLLELALTRRVPAMAPFRRLGARRLPLRIAGGLGLGLPRGSSGWRSCLRAPRPHRAFAAEREQRLSTASCSRLRPKRDLARQGDRHAVHAPRRGVALPAFAPSSRPSWGWAGRGSGARGTSGSPPWGRSSRPWRQQPGARAPAAAPLPAARAPIVVGGVGATWPTIPGGTSASGPLRPHLGDPWPGRP